MRSGSPTGTFSLESRSVVTQSMSATGSCTLLSSQARSPSSFTRRLEEGSAFEEDVELLRVICLSWGKPLYISKPRDAWSAACTQPIDHKHCTECAVERVCVSLSLAFSHYLHYLTQAQPFYTYKLLCKAIWLNNMIAGQRHTLMRPPSRLQNLSDVHFTATMNLSRARSYSCWCSCLFGENAVRRWLAFKRLNTRSNIHRYRANAQESVRSLSVSLYKSLLF